MKKLCSALCLFLCTVALCAQGAVTAFRGIPVDGSREEMIKKLEELGYAYNRTYDHLTGEFNGEDVFITLSVHNGKVWRLTLVDKKRLDQRDIRLRFNTLCTQFLQNRKYVAPTDDYLLIDRGEQIGTEMSENEKRYQAMFYQIPSNVDPFDVATEILPALLLKHTKEEIINGTAKFDEEKQPIMTAYARSKYKDNKVWFSIAGSAGEFYITMCYDNGRNEARGEDL